MSLRDNSAVLLLMVCVGSVVRPIDSVYAFLSVVQWTIAFVIIAGGNSVFGLLHLPVSHMLGSMAYSIYLLHGLVLFVVFRFIMAPGDAALLTDTAHWALISLMTPVLVCIAFLTFRGIERPALNLTSQVCSLLRQGRHGATTHPASILPPSI